MKIALNFYRDGLKNMLFPHVCEICGHQMPEQFSFVCEPCLSNKFEEIDNSEGKQEQILLPEYVLDQFAMWKFDKGGYLQDLLHNLKYRHLPGVGVDLGKQLGKKLLQNYAMIGDHSWLLIPVPLHYKKEKIRGYNQAKVISEGISKVTKLAVIDKSSVIRVKNTKTQTGFSLTKRNANISKAFKVVDKTVLKNRHCIIVDDVFTTGATTFELAKELKNVGAGKILIVTIASA